MQQDTCMSKLIHVSSPLPSYLDPAETILSSSICLPRSKEAHTTRSHIALNLLSCLNTLATSPPLTMEALTGSRMRKYDKDEFNCVVRFNGEQSTCVVCGKFKPDVWLIKLSPVLNCETALCQMVH